MTVEFEYWWLLIPPLFFALGWVAARVDIKQLISESTTLPAAYFKGLNFLISSQHDKAVDAFYEAIHENTDSLELHFALGSLFRRTGETDRAINMHLNLLDQKELTENQKTAVKAELAQDYLKAGLFDRAEELFKNLDDKRYRQPALNALLEIYTREREWSQAIQTATEFEIAGEDFTLFTGVDIGDTKRRETLERIFFHDIMNTATGMRGLSAMARNASPDDKDEVLGLLETTSDHLIDEISAQRELLAAESNELAAHPEPVRSRGLLFDIAGVYSSHDVGVGKVITIDKQSDDVLFMSDPALLARVIGNLVKNALEATEQGGLVTLACTKLGSRVGFSIHNDAHIPHRNQLQIFQRSFTTKGAGRGLGAYSSRLLTERYLNGDITFESSPESGTTFAASYPYEAPTGGDKLG